jgi:hypothetical protein
MFSAFVGSALAGYESDSNTWYGLSAGAGITDGNNNTFIGAWAGLNNNGISNTFLGSNAGKANTDGNCNTFVGDFAGSLSTGAENTCVGYFACGDYNTPGSFNTSLGTYAGAHSIGEKNTYVGYQAGYNNNSGSYNVFLGHMAGQDEAHSNKLYISNSNTATPLIYGEFDNSILAINGKLGIGTQTPARMLHLAGAAVFRMDRTADTAAFQMVRTDGSGNPLKVFVVGTNASGTNNGEFIINDNGTALSGEVNRRMTIGNTGAVTFPVSVTSPHFYTSSSLTLKDNVRTYENALDTVNRLRGVSFDWKDSGKPAVGLIAEEVAKVVPEVVAYNDGVAAGVNYASLVGVLVEAVKEQQAIVKEQQQAIKEQQGLIQKQEGIISAHSEKIAELERLLTSK